MSKKQFFQPKHRALMSGFTMIELVVVIVVLAILAAFAMPRFTNIQRDARIAKLNAARGSVAAAARLIHASIISKNGNADSINCAGTGASANNISLNGTVCTEGGLVTLTNGYPAVIDFAGGGAAPASAGILAAAGLTLAFNPSKAELNGEGYDYSVAGNVATFSVNGGTGICSFTYTAAAANAMPVMSTADTTGC